MARALLGLAFELEPFYAWAADDDVLATHRPAARGLPPGAHAGPFEMLVGAITAQQVSLYSALAIRNRFVERFGVRAGEAWSSPARETVAAANEEELCSVGFSRRKAEYVVGLARSELDLDELAGLPDAEVKERLTAVRGVGEWTAEWFLARHLARPNAWPGGDLALRKAVAALYGGLDVPEARPLPPLSEPHRPLPPTRKARPVIRTATLDDLSLVARALARVRSRGPRRAVARGRQRGRPRGAGRPRSGRRRAARRTGRAGGRPRRRVEERRDPRVPRRARTSAAPPAVTASPPSSSARRLPGCARWGRRCSSSRCSPRTRRRAPCTKAGGSPPSS